MVLFILLAMVAFGAPASSLRAASVIEAAKPTIRQSSSGPAVVELQTLLNGWIVRSGVKLVQLPTNGKFGPATHSAVLAFQRAHNLAAEGIVGPKTWAALEAYRGVAARPSAPAGGAAPMDDAGYRQYLVRNFSQLGPHTMQFEDVTFSHNRITGEDYSSVRFYIGIDEVDYHLEEDTVADRRVWAKALLAELKAHWPGKWVSGSLVWHYYSYNLRESDCHRVGSYFSGEGWSQFSEFASVYYMPRYNSEVIDCIF